MSPEFSRILNRQIQKHLGERGNDESLKPFLSAINETYRSTDRDRELLERSLELTSNELTALNERSRQEKTQALDRLSESEQILQSINENLSEGVFRLDITGKILFANRAFRELLDLPKDRDSIAENFENLFADPDTWFTLKSMIEINGFVKSEETQMSGKQGMRIWVLISMVRVTVTGKGEVYDGSIINITQQKETERNLRRANDILANTISIRKKAEEDLRRALEKEKELTELKSRLVSMTSHEFRTPLTTIQTNTELLSIKLADLLPNEGDRVRRHLDRIMTEIGKITRLMDDVLLMGKYESGRITYHPEETDLEALIREIIQTKGTLGGDTRTVKMEVTGTPRPIQADPHLLSHALTNLITNALKYSVECPEPEVTLSYEEPQVSIRIRDFGIGIPRSEQANLFQTFFRASNTINIQGTGMGLVIVKVFIEMHGGTIRIESDEGKGTLVLVTLPNAGHA